MDLKKALITGSKEQMLRDTLIDNIPAQIFWKDLDSIYLGCKKAFLYSLGLKREDDVIGKSDFDLPVSRKNSVAYRAGDLDVMVSGRSKLGIEERQVLNDGTERVLSTSKVPLIDGDGNVYGVLADIGLPGKLGDELTRMIRAYERDNHLKPTKIVGLTGHALGKMKQQCLEAGMNDVYRKPISSDDLNALIGSVSTRIDDESSHGTLGEDLPDTEAQLFEIEQHPLFDLQVALHHFGSESVARDVLTTLKTDGITDDLARIKAAHEQGDWVVIEKLTHKIKGGACYGTVRLYYALLYMERYLKAGHMNCAERLYAQMLQVIEESMVYLDDWLKR